MRGRTGDGTGEPVGRRSGREDNSDPSDFSDDSDKGGKEAGRNCRRTGGTVERQGKVRVKHRRTGGTVKVFPDLSCHPM